MTFWRGDLATQNVFIVYMHDIVVLMKLIGGNAVQNKSIYIPRYFCKIYEPNCEDLT